MDLSLYTKPTEFSEAHAKGTHVVVIDVLRASSTIVHACENGAERIIPVVEVEGAGIIRRKVSLLPDDHLLRSAFVDIFLLPPSMDVLRRRLKERGDPADDVKQRLRIARREMGHNQDFMHRIYNDVLEDAVEAVLKIMALERAR